MATVQPRFIKTHISQFVETLSRHSLKITAAAVVSCVASHAHADALPAPYNSNTLTQNTGTLYTDQQNGTSVTIWNSNQTYQNTSTGQIVGANDSGGYWNNISVLSGGTGNAFVNDGQMSGGRNIYYSGDQTYVLNNGTIDSHWAAIAIDGVASTAKNVGTINLTGQYASTAMGYWGTDRTASTYANLINSGTINLGQGDGLFTIGAYTNIQNSGQIVGASNTSGIVVQAYPWSTNYSANYVSVTNSGNISVGQYGFGIDISGRNGLPSNPTNLPLMYGDSIVNSGTIESSSANAIAIRIGQYANHATVTNSQTGVLQLSGNQSSGINIASGGNAESVYNSGFIKVTGNQSIGIKIDSNGEISNNQANGIGVLNSQSGTIYGQQTGLLNNYATISGASVGLYNQGLFGAYYDSNQSLINSTVGISNLGSLAGTGIGSVGLRNIGTIGGTNAGIRNGFGGSITGASYGIENSGSITSIVNAGSISGGVVGISNNGSITTLSNAQGGSTPLTYTGTLPTNYNIIINGLNNYGRLSGISVTGALNFGIYNSSTWVAGTYANVLTGLQSSNITNYASIYDLWNTVNGGYKWKLSAGANATSWNLIVAQAVANMTSGTAESSGLGSSINPAFDGGRLRISAAGNIIQNFTVSSANGTIDQNALASNFTGIISDAVTGTAGKLIIANSGTAQQGKVILSGSNTYTGGTDVESGAVLSIGSASALGSGALNLVGSATIPATLETTQTMTISNPITVSGDPVFSVASGTTTTVSSPIADGSSAGDVVVSGGGTLNLTAVNTYTGPTTVDAGSMLALSGSGSITTSNAVTNNGTFDLTNATSTVNLGGSFTQSGTGSLNMVAAPDAFQKIVIAGTASLGGSLGLTAAAGNYRIGRYTLLNAGSVIGTFSSFTNNLSSVTPLGYLLSYDASNVYLNLAPNASATYQGIQQNSQSLGNVINIQAAALQAGLSYDCAQYDENNLCVSVGRRYTYAGTGPSGNAQSGLVIVGYRPTQSTRIGAFADQSVNISTPNNIMQSKTSPMWGLFGNWQMHKDGNGLNVQASAAFAASELTINRNASGITEAGSGKTQFDGQAYQLQANYAQPVTDATKLVPYLGVRHTRINQGAYNETSNAQTLYPVSYNAMAQNTFSAIGGIGVQRHLAEKLKGTVSVGVQQNLNYSMGNYSGSSTIPGMTTFSTQMPGNTNTMATASAGVYYSVRKNEQLGLTTLWQQQPFINTNTTSVIATYTIGL